MAVSGSGVVGLRGAALHLAQLGSLLVLHLPPRALWTWVFVKGGRTISETAVLQGEATQQAHLLLPLSLLPTPESNSQLELQRWQYCASQGVMGGLCDEVTPDPLPMPSPRAVARQEALAGVPVIMTAGSRNQYLYYSLTALLAAPGAQHRNILVVLGDAPQRTTQLLRLMNVTFTTLPVHGHANNKLFHYYRSVFRLVAHKFPDAPAVILLDEDVQVSPDFFSFMSQTLWLLKTDPTLYCVNAHAPVGLKGLAYDDTRIMRGAIQVEWGYAVTLDFVREALTEWETITNPNTLFYDFWLYLNIRKGRECLFPEVSRTLHFGFGVNTDAHLKEKFFLTKPLVKRVPVELRDVGKLQLSSWQRELSLNISMASPLRGNPCRATFLPSPPFTSLYVFYYRLDIMEKGYGQPDPYQFYILAECLKTWSMSEQGHHQGVHIVRFSSNATLYLVGVPYSQYSHLRPKNLPLWDVDAVDDHELEQMTEYVNTLRGELKISNENVTLDMVVKTLSITQ
ncbi:protein O-linked-mannose beta-1,2-N-acetylglucosaminyltransferase 1-like [Homarus americanus]|nr:protein O-linked-mannose beta-1,2-N-acetylglucosaminyltransferase 1-like [Homarus americanus]